VIVWSAGFGKKLSDDYKILNLPMKSFLVLLLASVRVTVDFEPRKGFYVFLPVDITDIGDLNVVRRQSFHVRAFVGTCTKA